MKPRAFTPQPGEHHAAATIRSYQRIQASKRVQPADNQDKALERVKSENSRLRTENAKLRDLLTTEKSAAHLQVVRNTLLQMIGPGECSQETARQLYRYVSSVLPSRGLSKQPGQVVLPGQHSHLRLVKG